jgi:hypothetical protein
METTLNSITISYTNKKIDNIFRKLDKKYDFWNLDSKINKKNYYLSIMPYIQSDLLHLQPSADLIVTWTTNK